MNEKRNVVIHVVFLFLIATIFVAGIYLINNLSYTHFEEIIFSLYSTGIGNTDYSTVLVPLSICLPIILVLTLILYVLFYGINLKILRSSKIIFKHLNKHKVIYSVVFFLIALIILGYSCRFFEYFKNLFTNSNFIEQNYINPKETTVSFYKKNNLILIFVESLENTLFTKEHGGAWDYEVIPELYNLGQEKNSISFDAICGMKMIRGASWTSASVITNNTGVPLKIGFNEEAYSSKFMPGTYSLGELLKDNGYYNEVISAANTSFGNLDMFYKQHGDYEIVDIDSIRNYGLIIEDKDKGNWGFNDNCLFKVAKERLNDISKKDEPFNLQLITIDTHFFDGFIGDYSKNDFNNQYENAYATESMLINDFVNWVKDQPFFEDTTIVIIGDHQAMQSSFINNKMFNNRSVYSLIINPYNKETIDNQRIFTALDSYPTIVSAIGGKIEGERIGLGVNLFSNEATLAEKYGFKNLDNELKKRSSFYNKEILCNK